MTAPALLKRGDINWVDIPQTHVQGSETYKKRPWLILSRDDFNFRQRIVVGCPLTTRVETTIEAPYHIRLSPDSFVAVPGAEPIDGDRLVLTEQLRALARQRIGTLVGRVKQQVLAEVEAGVLYVLDLKRR